MKAHSIKEGNPVPRWLLEDGGKMAGVRFCPRCRVVCFGKMHGGERSRYGPEGGLRCGRVTVAVNSHRYRRLAR